MKKVEIVKAATAIVVSIGVGAIVANVIKCTTPSDVKRVMKVCINLGGFVLASMVSDMASTYAEEKIDEVVDTFNETAEEIKKARGQT